MKFFRQKYPISGTDIDPQYRLTPHAVLAFSQDSAARYMAQHRMAAFDVIADNLIWVISETGVEISDELPFWSEEIEIEVWVSEISALRLYVEFSICDDRRRNFACGHYIFSLLHRESRRLTPLGALASRIERHEATALDSHKRPAFPAVTESAGTTSHLICFPDVDFNYHVGNRCYPAIAERLMPVDYRETHTVRRYDIRFRSEAFLGERIVGEMFRTEQPDHYAFRFTRESDNALLCLIDSVWQPLSPRTIHDRRAAESPDEQR